jgi:PAP2 superfamily C-terminal
MKNFIRKQLIDKHRKVWPDLNYTFNILISIFLFVISLVANYEAMKYSALSVGNATTDILLQNIPLVDTHVIFNEGALVFVLFVVLIFIFEPISIPFSVKTISLFIFVRSLFVSMTHLAPYADHINIDSVATKYFTTGSDLFFSGHTGLPFLLALIFWKKRYLRFIFISASIIGGASVLLGHLHYTIDVFSAYFITYGVFQIAIVFFKKDFKMFSKL